MKFEDYLQTDQRLQKVNELAKALYSFGGAHLHNYPHARWDTDMIIRIGETERLDTARIMPAGLLHDTGVAIGPYEQHAPNGEKVARLFLPQASYNDTEVEEIAIAIGQHNETDPDKKDLRKRITAQVLFDADTLNKSGVHGLNQYVEVSKERNWDFRNIRVDLELATVRYFPYSQRLVEHGFYTETAKEIDREMGNSRFGGLELVAKFWETVQDKLRNGNLTAREITQLAKESIGVEE